MPNTAARRLEAARPATTTFCHLRIPPSTLAPNSALHRDTCWNRKVLDIPSPLTDLLRRAVLIVEDEFMQAEALRLDLLDHGAEVIGPVSDLEDALACIAATPELAAAILDVDLHGRTSYPVADALLRRGVPFVFVTGHDRKDLVAGYDGVPLVEKPATVDAMVDALIEQERPVSRR